LRLPIDLAAELSAEMICQGTRIVPKTGERKESRSASFGGAIWYDRAMHNLANKLSAANIGQQLDEYVRCVEEIRFPIANAGGLRLLESLKRDKVNAGPYPSVALFEAANRIMTDLVILYGVKWLLDKNVFPFQTYTVEFGTENNNGFDIRAENNGKILIGEAFNVAPSFFQTKKTSMLKKLRYDTQADFKLIMVNQDAVAERYNPKAEKGEYYLFVQVGSGIANVLPSSASNGISNTVPITV